MKVLLLVGGLALALVLPGGAPSHSVARCSVASVGSFDFSATGRWIAFDRSCGRLPALVIVRPDGTGRRVVGRDVVGWTWAPRGDRIAYQRIVGERTSLFVAASRSRGRKVVDGAVQYSWAPSGRELVTRRARDQRLLVVTVQGRVRQLTDAPVGTNLYRHALAWSPAGGRILFTRGGDGASHSIHVVSPDGTGEVSVARGGAPGWSADGRRILYAVANGDRWATVSADGSAVRVVGPECAERAEWAPRGRFVAFQARCGGFHPESDWPVYVGSGDGGATTFLGTGDVVWSPTGRRLALVRTWEQPALTLVDADGRRRLDLPFVSGPRVDWSPNGRRVLIADGRVYVFSALGGGGRSLALGDRSAWSPDGRRIAITDHRDACGDALYVLRLSPRKLRRLVSCSEATHATPTEPPG